MAAPVISSPASDTRNVAMTCAIVSAATSDRRNPQPSSTAMMARSRNPLSFVLSGVFSSACACFWDSQFHTKPVDFESLVRGLETFLETRNRRAQTGNVVPASMGRNPAALTKERSAMLTNTNPLLLVDDDLTNQDLLSRRLKRAGYANEVAGSGYEALDVLARREVELVLLDSMMPGLSGIELLRQLRQRFSPARLPIIMVTALGESERVVEALNLGANDYISKPVDFPVALARIKAQLERKRAEHALRESEERYALAARGANDGLWDWDLETQRVYFSPRWKAMLGYEEAEIGDGPEEWLSRVHKEDRATLGAELAAHWNATANKECAIEHRVLHKDGSYRWMLSRGVVERDGQGKATRMAGSQTDITSSKAFDPLIGLPNRTLFHDKLADHQRDRPSRGGGRDHEHHARERHGAYQGDRGPESGRRAKDPHPYPVSRRVRRPLGDRGSGRHPPGHDSRRRARIAAFGTDHLPLGMGHRWRHRVLGDRRRVRHVPGLEGRFPRSDRGASLRIAGCRGRSGPQPRRISEPVKRIWIR